MKGRGRGGGQGGRLTVLRDESDTAVHHDGNVVLAELLVA